MRKKILRTTWRRSRYMYAEVHRKGKLLDLVGTKESPWIRAYAWTHPSFGASKEL